MAPSDKRKHHAGSARGEYDEHLNQVEDRLEAAAQKTDAAFREHTARAQAKLALAEDKLEAAAHKAENRQGAPTAH